MGRVKMWNAVLFSISLDTAEDPKNTEAKTGRSRRTNDQTYPKMDSFVESPIPERLRLGNISVRLFTYLRVKKVIRAETRREMTSIR